MDTEGVKEGDVHTTPFNGEARLWWNGQLMGEYTDVNFSEMSEDSRSGWAEITFFENQSDNDVGQTIAYVDFDEIVIYNQTPPNTDTSGNAFIGPLDWTSGPVDGVCGTADGGTFSSAPTTNLCSAGTPTTVLGPDPNYSWTCEGTGGSEVNAACSATYEAGSAPPNRTPLIIPGHTPIIPGYTILETAQ